jgi:hypothetical protein
MVGVDVADTDVTTLDVTLKLGSCVVGSVELAEMLVANVDLVDGLGVGSTVTKSVTILTTVDIAMVVSVPQVFHLPN